MLVEQARSGRTATRCPRPARAHPPRARSTLVLPAPFGARSATRSGPRIVEVDRPDPPLAARDHRVLDPQQFARRRQPARRQVDRQRRHHLDPRPRRRRARPRPRRPAARRAAPSRAPVFSARSLHRAEHDLRRAARCAERAPGLVAPRLASRAASCTARSAWRSPASARSSSCAAALALGVAHRDEIGPAARRPAGSRPGQLDDPVHRLRAMRGRGSRPRRRLSSRRPASAIAARPSASRLLVGSSSSSRSGAAISRARDRDARALPAAQRRERAVEVEPGQPDLGQRGVDPRLERPVGRGEIGRRRRRPPRSAAAAPARSATSSAVGDGDRSDRASPAAAARRCRAARCCRRSASTSPVDRAEQRRLAAAVAPDQRRCAGGRRKASDREKADGRQASRATANPG